MNAPFKVQKPRGRIDLPSKYELEFWVKYRFLLTDDPEEKYNHIVSVMRHVAELYFQGYDSNNKSADGETT